MGDGGRIVEISVVRDLRYYFVGAGWEEVGVDFEAEFERKVQKTEDFTLFFLQGVGLWC